MGFFSKIAKLIQAKVNEALDDMENPIEMLDQKHRNMDKTINDAKIASDQILGGFRQAEKKMKQAQQESIDWDERVKLAMSKGNVGLAKRALGKKLESEESYEAEKVKADILKKRFIELQAEVEKTRNYRDEAVDRLLK